MIPETLKPGAHRVHSSYVWLGSLPIILSLIVASLPGLAQVLTLILIVPLMALIAVLVLGLRVLGWTRLSYELSETEFRKSWGVVFKRKTHVPYQRIQSVNQSARPLQRVVGVCDVRIETAGGSSNEAVVLQCMRVSEVEALRGELFRRKKVLLDGGSLDAWGSATVDGVVYPSQWACIQYGIDPSQARPVRVDGTPVDVASSTRASAPSAPSGGISVAGSAQPGAEANLLGGVAAASDRFRGLDGGEAVETGPVSYETGLSNVELLLAGLTGIGSSVGVVLAALFGALGYLPSVVNDRLRAYFEEMAGSSLDPVLSLQAGDMASFSANGLVGAIAIALLVLFILLVFSALGSMLTYGSFRLRRRGSRIEIESGLVSRAFHGIDVDRVQSIVIDQSFFRRLIGYCEIRVEKIDTLDPSQKQAGQAAHGTILHPFIKLSRVPSLLDGILPEFASYPDLAVRPAPAALRRGIMRIAVWRNFGAYAAIAMGVLLAVSFALDPLVASDQALVVLISIARGIIGVLLAFCLIDVVLSIVRAVLWFKGSGIGYDRRFMTLVNGGFSRRTSVVPRQKIQFATLSANPFQRASKVRCASVRTAAGIDGKTTTLWDLSLSDANAWLEWARPRG